MRDRRLSFACTLLAVVPLLSCASSPDSAWGEFSGAWADAASDSSDFFGEQFFLSNEDDPYALSPEPQDTGSAAARLFLDRGRTEGQRVPRGGQNRGENSAGDLWAWLLDLD